MAGRGHDVKQNTGSVTDERLSFSFLSKEEQAGLSACVLQLSPGKRCLPLQTTGFNKLLSLDFFFLSHSVKH